MSGFFRARALVASLLLASGARAALLVDDFEGEVTANTLGGIVAPFTDSGSAGTSLITVDRAAGHDSANALRLDYELGPGADYPFVGVVSVLSPGATPVDLSDYAGVRFWSRGTGQASLRVNLGISATLDESNHFGATALLTEDWTLHELPFSALTQAWGTPETWDPTTVVQVELVLSGSAALSGYVELDGLEFYQADEALAPVDPNPIRVEPRVNQVGYLPGALKRFTIVQGPAAAGDAFEIYRESDVVLTGTLVGPIDALATAGETVLVGDFSALTEPGRYVVSVAGVASPPFDVGEDVYAAVYRDAARAFYPIRSGVAIDDPVTGIAHAVAHADDAPLLDDPTTTLDLAGGWYNAGDFGKWVHMASIATSYMMLLHELNGASLADVSLAIPESPNELPDLLDQARWGLDWLLKMQLPDGSVLHKVDSGEAFGWGLTPDQHTAPRFAMAPSSMDAAWFTGTLLIAERVFRPYDAPFADRCRAAAERAFAWLVANPDVRHEDPFYLYYDDSQHQEYVFALAEMARATGDPVLIEEVRGEIASQPLVALSWMDPQILGYFSVAQAPALDAELRAAATAKIVAAADYYASIATADGHGVAAEAGDYYWGSLEAVLNRCNALIFAHELTGEARYRDAALSQLDYVLGRNALARSYVVGHGEGAIQHPHHWANVALGIALPGWMGGGPNNQENGGDTLLEAACLPETPPQKCHVDAGGMVGSWASNEGQLSEAGALVFAVGYFTHAPAPTPGAGGAGGATGAGGAEPASGAPAPGADGGCGCGLPRARVGGAALLGLGLLLGLAGTRRRRPSRGYHSPGMVPCSSSKGTMSRKKK